MQDGPIRPSRFRLEADDVGMSKPHAFEDLLGTELTWPAAGDRAHAARRDRSCTYVLACAAQQGLTISTPMSVAFAAPAIVAARPSPGKAGARWRRRQRAGAPEACAIERARAGGHSPARGAPSGT